MNEVFSHTNSKGVTYYLHTQEVTLKAGHVQRIYFFAKEIKEDKEKVSVLPEGYTVKENVRTGLPYLTKKQ